jgi:hypothetical protein
MIGNAGAPVVLMAAVLMAAVLMAARWPRKPGQNKAWTDHCRPQDIRQVTREVTREVTRASESARILEF